MLSGALLTASDLPGQFAVTGTPSGVGDSSLSGCPTLSSDPAGATATASVALTAPTDGSGVTEVLMQFPAASAAQAMASFAALPTTCPTVAANIQGIPVSFTTAPLAIPSLGDASTATRMTGPLPAVYRATLYEDVVAIRHANTMVFVLVTQLAADTNVTTTAARAAFDRVAARW